MKKKYFLYLFIFIAIFMFFIKEPNSDNEIRVRVVPNSNSTTDIETKNFIKEDVIVYLAEQYDEDYNSFCQNIKKSIHSLSSKLNEKNSCKVSFEYHTFYNKTYNDSSLKNERKLTLLVIIGSGKGDNWWGSIYPHFLEINSTDTVEYKSYIWEQIKKWIGE